MQRIIKTPFFFKLKRRLSCFFSLLFAYKHHKNHISNFLAAVINDMYKKKYKAAKIKLDTLTGDQSFVSLSLHYMREGNTTYFEQIALASLVKHYKSKNILELGTFNGQSTLTLALNSDEKSFITTVDMPSDLEKIHSDLLDKDIPFILDKEKQNKLYKGLDVSKKIRQIYADLTHTDFNSFLKDNRYFDFIFIDAGHSYDCVKNDTEKSLDVLTENGVIVWHDYTPNCLGVFNYLNELSRDLRLFHIEKTTLVIYRREKNLLTD